MIAKKDQPAPSWIRILGRTLDPARNCSLGNVEAQLEQLTVDARCAPRRVLGDHAENQLAHFPAQGFPSGGVSSPRQPRPVPAEARAMPTHHRFWGDEQERFLPPRPQLSESDPEHLVDRAQSPPRSFGMESQQLLTQCQILQHEILAGSDRKSTR